MVPAGLPSLINQNNRRRDRDKELNRCLSHLIAESLRSSEEVAGIYNQSWKMMCYSADLELDKNEC